MYVNVENSLISDNPYYFYNEKSPKTPDSSGKGFSFFKRRNSKSSTSSSTKGVTPQKTRPINSATLGSDASILGSPRGSVGSLGSYGGTCFQGMEMQSSNFNTGSYKRAGFSHYRERLGSYNESVCYSESDDVFFQPPRHFITRTMSDTSNVTNGVRRHSVGNFTSRDRGRVGSLSDEVPNMVAPKPPAISPSKLRNDRRKDNCRSANMEDILIVTARHSERSMLWANFFKTRFDKITKQRGRKPFNFLHIKIDEEPLTSDITHKCSNTLLQIVILCPALIALPSSFLMSQLSAILNPEKVLGILLEVSEDKVLEIHKSAFPSFRKWRRCAVREHDQSLIGNVVGVATDILGRALCQLPPCQETNGVSIKTSSSTESFTVVPRKVKIGQNKVLALLNDPLTKDDWIKIRIEKAGEVIDITSFKKRNPYTLQFNIPESCMEVSTMVEIRIEKNEKDLGSRPIKCESRLRELEQLLRTQDSPLEFMCHSLGIGSTEREFLDQHLLHCFQRNIPPNYHLLAGPFEKQNNFLSTRDCSPEEYPTLLHFAAKWGLERLCIQLLDCPGGEAASEIRNYAGKTPAEIAEQEGYTKLAKSLKTFSQMHEFTTMYHYFKGISDSSSNKVVIEQKADSPKDKSKKFQDFEKDAEKAKAQAEYMEMSRSDSDADLPTAQTAAPLAVTNLNYINIDTVDDCNLQSSDELTKKIEQVKIIEEREIMSNELRINEPPYYQSNQSNNKADKFSQECSKLLESCSTLNSMSSHSDYILQPSNIPVNTTLSGDYMTHPSNRPVTMANYMNDPANRSNNSYNEDDSHLRMNFERKSSESRPKHGTLKRTGSDASKGTVDDELVEIMYDFKNNVLTIKEVEQLVDKWRNRNDVKQSFKEKQEQIDKMREEYEKVQEQMKAHLKRPTPFERIRKIFSRNKNHSSKHHKDDASEDTKSSITSYISGPRPISSLSLQSVSSSSSSGRMSTGSQCSGASLGDSGTHSDHEDRRHIFTPNSVRLGHPGSLMDNYLIPPPPRPVVTPASTPTPVEEKERLIFPNNNNISNSCNNISNRAVTPTNNNSSEHYIIFPSNVPVYPTPVETHSNHSSLKTIMEAKETSSSNNEQHNFTLHPIKVPNKDNSTYREVNRLNEVFSSFKPPTQNSVPNVVEFVDNAEIKKEMNEIYKNINNLSNNVGKDIEKFKDKNLTRQSSSESNSTKCSELNENNQAHDYMNI